MSPAELQKEELPQAVAGPASAVAINTKLPFSPEQLILLFNHNQWEEFIREWAHYQKSQYKLVVKLGGANDYGIDVAAFTTKSGFTGAWDTFQCKHYSTPLTPAVALPELAKTLWHTFNKRISVPENYYFFAPKDCGESLKKLLLDSGALKDKVCSDWNKSCSAKITKTQNVKLEGKFKLYVEAFDFSIFKYKPSLEVIEEHRKTPYHADRFGGGVIGAPKCKLAPSTPAKNESRYIEQLLEAYSDCGTTINMHDQLDNHPKFKDHFSRSRQTFYDAEALVSFARDAVPNGTFEELQDEVFYGVKDIEEDDHSTAFVRVKEVTKAAGNLNIAANGLAGVTNSKRLRGICHQLANDDKLIWKK
ncbi:ABC-three component system protein [Flexibacterium corallicola]|uniref:ABC-three component system protein n=1 Tax=Flexibacterium corallicola TaxID=3037259 RepID=UPI00286F6143|nr:ABC-three component system protein [Pseudovibrio sp. M1P-2-3]